MNNAILAKIQKLLALATSPNEHEARAAAAKAEELLVGHNLDMQTVMSAELDYDKVNAFEGARMRVESKFINSIVTEFFFVKAISTRTKASRYSDRKASVSVCFIGEKTNVQVAIFIHDFLTRKFPECFAQFQKETGASAKSRQSYYLGLYRGLREQLEAARSKVESERSLVLVADPRLDKAVMNLVGKTVPGRAAKIDARDYEAIQAGIETGKKLNLARGLGGPSEQSNKQLTQ